VLAPAGAGTTSLVRTITTLIGSTPARSSRGVVLAIARPAVLIAVIGRSPSCANSIPHPRQPTGRSSRPMSRQQTHNNEIATGAVPSADGTTIGYRRLGDGPALIVVSGAMISSKSHLGLARALADDYAVYLPDRRGRGLSGPYGANHNTDREVEDLTAMIDHTGAQRLFGVSVGALICLCTARQRPDLTKLALYEPAFVTATAQPGFSTTRLDHELATGRVAAALVTGMHEAHLAPPAVKAIPRFVMERLTKLAMKAEERKAAPDDVTMRALAPTLHHDFGLIKEIAGPADMFHNIAADVLLLGGGKSDAFFRASLDALQTTLPHATRLELPGLDHGGSTDRDGTPTDIAPALRRFFT
jgi:pimeloyl-ACP methyl ester carboxylesterase